MFSKIIVVIFLAILIATISSDKDEQDDEYFRLSSELFNNPYIGHHIATNRAAKNSVLSGQLDEEDLRKSERLIQSKELILIKKKIDLLKRTDNVLTGKYTKMYKSSRELDIAADDVIKYIRNVNRNDDDFVLAKKLLHQVEDMLLETVFNARTIHI